MTDFRDELEALFSAASYAVNAANDAADKATRLETLASMGTLGPEEGHINAMRLLAQQIRIHRNDLDNALNEIDTQLEEMT